MIVELLLVGAIILVVFGIALAKRSTSQMPLENYLKSSYVKEYVDKILSDDEENAKSAFYALLGKLCRPKSEGGYDLSLEDGRQIIDNLIVERYKEQIIDNLIVERYRKLGINIGTEGEKYQPRSVKITRQSKESVSDEGIRELVKEAISDYFGLTGKIPHRDSILELYDKLIKNYNLNPRDAVSYIIYELGIYLSNKPEYTPQQRKTLLRSVAERLGLDLIKQFYGVESSEREERPGQPEMASEREERPGQPEMASEREERPGRISRIVGKIVNGVKLIKKTLFGEMVE